MSRLHTMARFADPDLDPIPITHCEECDEPIYDGDYVYYFNHDYFCSEECILEFIGVERRFLYEEDY